MDEDLIVNLEFDDPSPQSGYPYAKKLLAGKKPFTALFAYNDLSAIGAIRAIREEGLQIPQDVSVVGFDDIHLAQFMLPPLTTVQMSCRDLTVAAVEGLRAGIEHDHPKHGKKEWHIPTRLVVRQSSTFPRGSLPALVSAGHAKRD